VPQNTSECGGRKSVPLLEIIHHPPVQPIDSYFTDSELSL